MSDIPTTVPLAGGQLGAQRHVCAFFHTRDEEYRTLLPFVQEGFRRGEKAVHLVDPALRADHLARLGAAGIDVAAVLARRQLELSDWNDTYLPGRTFDWRVTAARVADMQRRARAEGFPRTRLIGHGEWALEDPANLAPLVEYETRMTDVLSQFDDPVVCTYDRSRFPAGTVADLFRAHPISVVAGTLVENPLFVRASRFPSLLRGGVLSVLRERFLAALVAGARAEALDIVLEDALLEEVPVATIYLDVVQVSLHDIGRLWQQKRITVDQEHSATETARLALAQLRLHLPSVPSNGKHVVVACVEGELHDVGARMTADFLEMAGFEVGFLGANVPTETLVELVRQRPPQLLALSVSTTSSVGALRRALAAIRSIAGSQIPLAVGGHLFLRRPELPRQLGVLYARNAHEAVGITCRALGA